jgi:hypothetical protein
MRYTGSTGRVFEIQHDYFRFTEHHAIRGLTYYSIDREEVDKETFDKALTEELGRE